METLKNLPTLEDTPWTAETLPQTPFYLISKATLSPILKAVKEVLLDPHPSFRIHYALKANHNLELLKTFRNIGMGLDLVSGGEFDLACKVGFSPATDLVFSGVGKTRSELRTAIASNCFLINVESIGELHRILEISKELNLRANIGCRVNPDVDPQTHPYISTGLRNHKFGVDFETAQEIFDICWKEKTFLNPKGLSVHIGSQIQNLSAFSEAFTKLLDFAFFLEGRGIALEILDLGGGLGVDYSHPLRLPRFLEYAQILKSVLKQWCLPGSPNRKVVSELGRCLVAQSGILMTRVIGTKKLSGKNFLILDASMTELMRPALYHARHPMRVHLQKEPGSRLVPWEVVGPVCESSDTFGSDYMLPETLTEGDLLSIDLAGAYGAVMSNSYNLRPLPKEIFVG